jgi:hypothetical protein
MNRRDIFKSAAIAPFAMSAIKDEVINLKPSRLGYATRSIIGEAMLHKRDFHNNLPALGHVKPYPYFVPNFPVFETIDGLLQSYTNDNQFVHSYYVNMG